MKALHSFCVAIVAAGLLAGCGKSSTESVVNAPDSPASNVATLKQAVQAFNAQEGHYPKTLDELTPKYIAKIPDAPAGYKISYDPATGNVAVSR